MSEHEAKPAYRKYLLSETGEEREFSPTWSAFKAGYEAARAPVAEQPVSVDLEKCAKALIDAQHYSHTQYDRAEDLKLHKPYWTDAVKAVLDAAGVVHE